MAHGFYLIDEKGNVLAPKQKDKSSNCYFFFWQGVLLYNKECYKFLKKICRKLDITEGILFEDFPELVRYLSPDPFKDDTYTGSSKLYQVLSPDTIDIFRDEQWQYFMSRQAYYTDGNGFICADWDCGVDSIVGTYNDYKRLQSTNIDFASLIDDYRLFELSN